MQAFALETPKINSQFAHFASDKKRLTLFFPRVHTRGKETFITHQFVAFCREGKEEQKPRALLPFEVASIPFDIRFPFSFFSLAAFIGDSLHCCYIFMPLFVLFNLSSESSRGGHDGEEKAPERKE